MKRAITLLAAAALFTFSHALAQQIAFPGAEGAGRFTTGGRGTASVPTTVMEVTRLDDPIPTVAGTLRYAVTNNTPSTPYRTVVFRISGTIRLSQALSINRANTTIAGQTAPGDGICIADYPVSISADNVIVRFIRVRLGDRHQAARAGQDDAFSGLGRKNLIIDHCSVSWSNDECFTFYSGDSTTLQWNLISEPLDSSYHDEGSGVQRHGYGGIWGGRRASFHHNLIAHIRGRAPRFDGSRNLPNSNSPVVGTENCDFRNNVIYNWADYNVNGGEGGNYNVVNNYYKYGPSTPNTSTSGVNRRNMIINPGRQTSAPVLPYGKYYLSGNHVDNSATVTANNWLGAAMSGGSLADTNQSKVDSPFDIAPINTETALSAYTSVLEKAGAVLPVRDTLDQRIVNDVRNRTGRLINMQGGYPRGTDFNTTLTAWPTLNSTDPPADTDKDGMPDSWETSMGLNPSDPSDRNNYHANGYTMLENYLNGLTTVLPLQLLTFQAEAAGKAVRASWTTSNEVNTHSFTVERSIDGRQFAAVGSVRSNNNVQLNSYSFTDEKPVDGISYYRLKMMDKDGSFTFSAVIKINRVGKSALSMVPNPVVDRVVVNYSASSKKASLQIVSADGKQVLARSVEQGSSQSFFNLAGLQPGAYHLIFHNGTERTNLQFIKQ